MGIRGTSGPWQRVARWRRWVQPVSALLLNSYATQQVTKGLPCPALNCYACPAAACACPIGSLQHFVILRSVPFYVLGVVALAGVLVGRAACGWLCPFGWLQDLFYRLPLPKWRLPNRLTGSRYLVLAALVVLVPLLTGEPWFCKLCPAGTLEAGIPVVLLWPEMRQLIGTFFWAKLALSAALVAWMGVTRRPFCRWICPLGTLWSPFNTVSAVRLTVDQRRCTRCDRCQHVCPVDLRIYEAPSSGTCIRCLRCVRACPVGAVQVSTLRPPEAG